MIQRIQSVYLLLAVLFCGTLFFLPIAEFIKGSDTYIFSVFGVRNITAPFEPPMLETLPVLLILVISILLALVTIFFFKKRKLQIRLCGFNMLLLTALLASIFSYSDKAEIILGPDEVLTSFKFGAAAPIVAMVFIFLAIRAIKKDEELVRSADRIR